MEKKYMIGMFSVLVLAMFVVGLNIGNVGNSEASDSLDYGSNVCVYKNNELIGCQHNTVVNGGFDMVKNSLGEGGTNGITDLALGKGEVPSGSDTALDQIYSTAGLSKTGGAYNSNGVGNWSIAHTWTCTSDAQTVNTTALYKSGGALFAGTSFTSTTLQTDDQLKINYTLWVS